MTTVFSLMIVLVGLTSYGIWLSFGPPSKELEDTFEHHDD